MTDLVSCQGDTMAGIVIRLIRHGWVMSYSGELVIVWRHRSTRWCVAVELRRDGVVVRRI